MNCPSQKPTGMVAGGRKSICKTRNKYPDRIPNYLPYAGWSGFATKARGGAGGLGDRAAGAVGAGYPAGLLKAASAGSCGAYLRTIFGILGVATTVATGSLLEDAPVRQPKSCLEPWQSMLSTSQARHLARPSDNSSQRGLNRWQRAQRRKFVRRRVAPAEAPTSCRISRLAKSPALPAWQSSPYRY